MRAGASGLPSRMSSCSPQPLRGSGSDPPTEGELRNLIDSRVREEVLYRKALAAGLDNNDVVVR